MRRRFRALPALHGDQASAADPKAHAALSASAGTGKTQVLTARVLRLLLGGVRPEAILCLTFTKAAAAEMANRIAARLAAWVRLPDADLRKELFALGEANDPAALQRARRLFAAVLEAPGGLRIQTIHSFAQTLLASFPAEADIAPGFRPIEARAQQELARATLAALLADAPGWLLTDVQRLSLRLGEQSAVDYLMRCASRPDELAGFGDPVSIEPRLRTMLDLPEDSVEEFLASHCGDDQFDCDLLRAIAAANRSWGTATGAKAAEQAERWLALSGAERAVALPDLALIVFTGSGDLRKISAGLIKANADYEAHAERLGEAIVELLRIQNGARFAADMAAGLRAGQAFAKAYSTAKHSAGLADFDDLIRWTRRLLAKPGMGDWVRYKLDRQVDHLLVDEAQDTNPGQWEIVEALAAEFFTGSSETERRHRTLFMVGDFKQAIYRFQGADPAEFDRVRRTFRDAADRLRASEQAANDFDPRALEFRDLSIDASFRSAPAILDTVDAVIDEVGSAAMGLPDHPNRHRAFHALRPGAVELWAPFAIEETEPDESDAGEEGWIGAKERVYADRLASEIKGWLADAPVLDSTGRPLTPGDILILVRSRGELASLIVARLFAQNIPVAGIDRLHLQKPFAVRDLLAAVGFAVQPLDDLTLANLLVSPLIGLSQERLFELTHDRPGSLWAEVRTRALTDADLVAVHETLAGLLRMADFTPPSRFLETILSGPMQGRKRLYERLGLAARDPINELLSSAMQFEQDEVPSLERFLAWFSGGDVEIQRDPSAPANNVRVMTVHGAKGLEAPVVIIADATADPARLGRTPVSLDFPVSGVGVAPLLRPTKKERMAPFDQLIAREEALDLEEHWRLLYVGLTRASERLVIAGVEPRGRLSDNSWHRRVERALTALNAEVSEHPVWRQRMTYRGDVPAVQRSARKGREPLPTPALPEWATQAAPPEARPPRPLAPSAIAEDREPALIPTEGQRAAAERGTLIHALLERLPDVPPEQRRDLALAWLERSARLPVAGREEIADLVCGLLSAPEYGRLFGPGSFGEAPIAATLADGRVIAGTVDRLLVEERQVSVIDFKTGRVPADASAVPASHREQMRAYAEALAVIFPGRDVRSALLYTAGPTLFEIDG